MVGLFPEVGDRARVASSTSTLVSGAGVELLRELLRERPLVVYGVVRDRPIVRRRPAPLSAAAALRFRGATAKYEGAYIFEMVMGVDDGDVGGEGVELQFLLRDHVVRGPVYRWQATEGTSYMRMRSSWRTKSQAVAEELTMVAARCTPCASRQKISGFSARPAEVMSSVLRVVMQLRVERYTLLTPPRLRWAHLVRRR